MAKDEFCEATIGCAKDDDGKVLKQLFDLPTFSITQASVLLWPSSPFLL